MMSQQRYEKGGKRAGETFHLKMSKKIEPESDSIAESTPNSLEISIYILLLVKVRSWVVAVVGIGSLALALLLY
jgi:hypothetical protein